MQTNSDESSKKKIRTVAIFTSVLIGGTWRYINEMVQQWKEQNLNVMLIQADMLILHIDFWNKERHDSYEFPFSEDLSFLCKLLAAYHVDLIHYQHTLNTKLHLLKLPEMLGIPYVVTLHDYYMICPFIDLTYETGLYCREKGDLDCRQCLKRRNFYSRSFQSVVTDISAWRNFWSWFLKGAFQVVVPNEDVKSRYLKYYPGINAKVVENPELIKVHGINNHHDILHEDHIVNVGILGLINIPKGRDVLLRCSQLVEQQKLPFRFIVFGELVDYTKKIPSTCHVLGRYQEEEIYALIAKNDIDFFWFPAICPETYSYTLSIAIRAGKPVIGSNLGAIGERIQRHHWGMTYDYTESIEKIVERLITFSKIKSNYTNLIITNTTYPKAENYYQFNFDKVPISILPELFADFKRRELYELNHSKLHHLHGEELKQIVQMATSPAAKIKYITRLDATWTLYFFKSHSLKHIINKIIG